MGRVSRSTIKQEAADDGGTIYDKFAAALRTEFVGTPVNTEACWKAVLRFDEMKRTVGANDSQWRSICEHLDVNVKASQARWAYYFYVDLVGKINLASGRDHCIIPSQQFPVPEAKEKKGSGERSTTARPPSSAVGKITKQHTHSQSQGRRPVTLQPTRASMVLKKNKTTPTASSKNPGPPHKAAPLRRSARISLNPLSSTPIKKASAAPENNVTPPTANYISQQTANSLAKKLTMLQVGSPASENDGNLESCPSDNGPSQISVPLDEKARSPTPVNNSGPNENENSEGLSPISTSEAHSLLASNEVQVEPESTVDTTSMETEIAASEEPQLLKLKSEQAEAIERKSDIDDTLPAGTGTASNEVEVEPESTIDTTSVETETAASEEPQLLKSEQAEAIEPKSYIEDTTSVGIKTAHSLLESEETIKSKSNIETTSVETETDHECPDFYSEPMRITAILDTFRDTEDQTIIYRGLDVWPKICVLSERSEPPTMNTAATDSYRRELRKCLAALSVYDGGSNGVNIESVANASNLIDSQTLVYYWNILEDSILCYYEDNVTSPSSRTVAYETVVETVVEQNEATLPDELDRGSLRVEPDCSLTEADIKKCITDILDGWRENMLNTYVDAVQMVLVCGKSVEYTASECLLELSTVSSLCALVLHKLTGRNVPQEFVCSYLVSAKDAENDIDRLGLTACLLFAFNTTGVTANNHGLVRACISRIVDKKPLEMAAVRYGVSAGMVRSTAIRVERMWNSKKHAAKCAHVVKMVDAITESLKVIFS